MRTKKSKNSFLFCTKLNVSDIPKNSKNLRESQIKLDFDEDDISSLPTYVKIDPDFTPTKNIQNAPSQNYQNLQNLSSDFYENFINSAPFYSSELIFNDNFSHPPWKNRAKIKNGKKFIYENYYSVLNSNIVGFFTLLSIKPIQALLLRNSFFHLKNETKGFVSGAILKLGEIYEWDFEDLTHCPLNEVKNLLVESGRNFKKFIPPLAQELTLGKKERDKFRTLRRILDKVGREEDMNKIQKIVRTLNPDVPLSQYDIAMVQFSFFAHFSLFPSLFQINSQVNSKGIDGFIHIWALIGHYLGLKDEFNLALHFNPQNLITIHENIFKFSFIETDELSFKYWDSLSYNLHKFGLSKYCYTIDLEAVIHYFSKYLFKTEPRVELKLGSKVVFKLNQSIFYMSHFFLTRALANESSRKFMGLRRYFYHKNKKIVKKSMSVHDLSVRWSSKEGIFCKVEQETVKN